MRALIVMLAYDNFSDRDRHEGTASQGAVADYLFCSGAWPCGANKLHGSCLSIGAYIKQYQWQYL